MSTFISRHPLRCSAIALATALFSTAALAAPSQRALEVLASRASMADTQLPSHARAGTGISGALNAGALAASSLELSLADGRRLTARVQRVVKDGSGGTQSWVGTFEDSPGSVLVLSKARGVVSGYATYGEETLEIVPTKGGRHLLFAVDGKKIPSGDAVIKSTSSGAEAGSAPSGAVSSGAAADGSTAVVQDVLLVYTAASAAAWGQATLEGMIQSAVQSAIQAYQNSGADITLNVVGLQQVAMSESGSGMQATLSALTKNTEVRSLRDKLAADMVVLVSQDSDWCGYASLQWTTTSAGTNYDAYAVTYSQCLSNQTLAHELGHLQGLDHNRENAGNSATYPYSYGYRVCGSGGFLDIMSYNCSTSTPRILNFSNPYVYYNGYATGIAYNSDPSRSAEAARTLNETAARVAGYRVGTTSPSTVPTAPSALTVQSAAYNNVSLAWSDNSSNETGFSVFRSGDGVNFTEVATLGSGASSYSDATVAARSTYYYKVRAFGSAGASAFSNTVNVTTPDVPPPPPAAPGSVSTANNGDGTASVSWVASSGKPATYEVRRETWNSRKKTWSRATTAATVPASVLSFVDAAGAGTYRYSVRAVNSGGASAFAGPAEVTVTTSSSGTTSPKGPSKGRGKSKP